MHRSGFSLVELSIVLVILGLLTGGILAGQSLIRASELRAVTSEYQRYSAATNTFRDKYFATPGDFRDATRFWSRMTATADCVTNSAAAGPNANGSCDGNGDGIINSAGASQASETMQFWRQLALAGLIEGSYSGQAGAGGGADMTFRTNIPASKLGSAGWSTGYSAPGWAGGASSFAGDYLNYYMFGAKNGTNGNSSNALKPEELWNIDTKMDDGKPAVGKVLGNWNSCTNAADGTAASVAAASYALSTSPVSCFAYFIRAF